MILWRGTFLTWKITHFPNSVKSVSRHCIFNASNRDVSLVRSESTWVKLGFKGTGWDRCYSLKRFSLKILFCLNNNGQWYVPGPLLLHIQMSLDHKKYTRTVQLSSRQLIIFHKTIIRIPLTFHGIYWIFLICARLPFSFLHRIGFSSEHHESLFTFLYDKGECFLRMC